MKRELRVASLLTSPLFLATLAVFCGQLVLLRGGWIPGSEALVPLFVILLLQQLTFRVVRVGAADTWRLLPGGFTVFIRALALLMLGLALLVGGLWSWSNGQLAFNSVPLGRIVFCFVFLSAISIVVMATIRVRRGELFLVAGVIGSAMLLAALFQSFASAAFWWTIALLFAAAWLYACSGKLPPPPVSRRSALAAVPAVRGWQVRFNSPVRNLLQLEGKGPGRLAIATFVVVICAVVQHKFSDRGALVDQYSTSATMPIWLAVMFLFEMALTMTSRARLLWMRTGNGRGGVFLEVERVLLLNLVTLCFVAWLATTLLAASRGLSIPTTLAGMMLPGLIASALGPMYLALMAGTLQGWLSKAPLAVVGVAAMVISPLLWLYALGIRNGDLDAPDYSSLVMLGAATLLLRYLAAWRWRHLDWSKIRITRREQWINRARSS